MRRGVRLTTRLRRLARRLRKPLLVLRGLALFSAVFGGAYGFITAATAPAAGYNPHAFAIGVSALFALACVALAGISMRLRFVHRQMRALAAHNERLCDRNWELQEAEHRARERLQLLTSERIRDHA